MAVYLRAPALLHRRCVVSPRGGLATHAAECPCPPCRSLRGEGKRGRDPVVGFRLPGDQLPRVAGYASREGIGMSEALRRLLTAALDAEDARGEG